jgi:hypothetical protein
MDFDDIFGRKRKAVMGGAEVRIKEGPEGSRRVTCRKRLNLVTFKVWRLSSLSPYAFLGISQAIKDCQSHYRTQKLSREGNMA